MNIYQRLLKISECAAELYREPERSLFYRKSRSIEKYYRTLKLPEYTGEPLYPYGVRINGEAVEIDIKGHFHIRERVIREKDPELLPYIKDGTMPCFYSYIPAEHTVGGNMWTHSIPNYERILSEGLSSYVARIEKISDKDMREGLLALVDGISCYAERCANYLESVNAEERLVRALRNVPMKPASNLYEAVVCWNFIFYIDDCDDIGCLANGLMPYFKGEDIRAELACMFDNVNANDAWSMSMGTEGDNPLTLQILDALKGKRRPSAELFVGDHTTSEVWKSAANLVKTGGGQPSFYNRKVLFEGLLKRFPEIAPKDITRLCGGGCTETMLAGISNVDSLAAGINLGIVLERSINEHLEKSSDFEEFYDKFMTDVRSVSDNVMDSIYKTQEERIRTYPIPIRTLLVDDCIDKQLEFNSGGARYCWSVVNFAGLINVIDSLVVIKRLVFDKKQYTASQLLTALHNNNKDFLSLAHSFPESFGNGCNETNALAYRVSHDVFSTLDDKKTHIGLGFLPSSIQFITSTTAGACVGATPDGRADGAPLCESLAALNGKASKGATVLLSDVCSLALDKALGIPVVNLTIDPEMDNDVLISLIKSYIDMGGIQLQVSCTSRKTLIEAYENPELHRDLIVRVGGYSEYFHRLPKDLQRHIIARNINDR